MASFSWTPLLLLLLIINSVTPLECYACEEMIHGDPITPTPSYAGEPYKKDCNQVGHSSTQNCEYYQPSCGIMHIKACKDGRPFEMKVKKCTSEAEATSKIVSQDTYRFAEYPGLSRISAELRTCRGPLCNSFLRTDPLPVEGCDKPENLVECFNCFEKINGSTTSELSLSCDYDSKYWKTKKGCIDGCQTLHIKACRDGVTYSERIRGCRDRELLRHHGSLESTSCLIDLTNTIAKGHDNWAKVATKVCTCSEDKCNGPELATEAGDGGCRKEPPTKAECTSGSDLTSVSGWMGVILALWRTNLAIF